MVDFEAAGGAGRAAGRKRATSSPRRAARRASTTRRCGRPRRSACRLAFERFAALRAAGRIAARRTSSTAFVEREGWWLETYALFRALHDEHGGALLARVGARRCAIGIPRRSRRPARTAGAGVRYYQYLQWIADEQWQRARDACGAVGVFGDFPFMVNGHSADVWARQREFHLDASVGVPPAPGAARGQDWGLPPYRWEVVAPDGYAWLAERTRRCAELFDAFRVDHLVGFYRTFIRERGGRRVLLAARRAVADRAGRGADGAVPRHGSCIIAEDLGVVPDFVRESQARHGGSGPQGAALGARVERRRASRSAIRAAIPPARSRSAARTTPNRWPTGGMRADLDERRAVAALPDVRDAGVEPRRAILGPDARRAALGAVPRRFGLRADHAAGRLRMARSHQHAVAGRATRTGPGGCPGRWSS